MSIADQTFQESVQALANWRQFLALKREEYIRQLERARSASQDSAPVENEPVPVQSPPPNLMEPAAPPPVSGLDTWEVVPIPEPAPNLGPDLNVWDVPGESVLPDEADIFQLTDPLVSSADMGGNGHDLEASAALEASATPASPSQTPSLSDLGIASTGLPWSVHPEPPAADIPSEDQGLPDWL